MPFLDVVTATIGVFLLIFAVQVIQAVVENRQLQPDQVILCVDPDGWSLFTDLNAAEQRFERWEKDRMLESMIAASPGVANVMLAIGPDCGRGAHEVSRLVQDTSVRVPADPGQARPTVRLMQWPLGSREQAQELISRWRGEQRAASTQR